MLAHIWFSKKSTTLRRAAILYYRTGLIIHGQAIDQDHKRAAKSIMDAITAFHQGPKFLWWKGSSWRI